MISPIDLILRSFGSSPRPYDWEIIAPHIDEWLQGSVDIIKLFRFLLIGKRCQNLTKSYFSILFQLLYNTTAATLAFYLKERRWCEMLVEVTTTATSTTSKDSLLAHISSLQSSPLHQQWISAAIATNKQQFAELTTRLTDAYQRADFTNVFQLLYTIYEFSFRNGHLIDALAVLSLLSSRIQTQYFDSMKNRAVTSQEEANLKLMIQWVILLQIKKLDLQQLFATFYGLTFENLEYFLNLHSASPNKEAHIPALLPSINPTNQAFFTEHNKRGIVRNEYIGAPHSLFEILHNDQSVRKMSLFGGIDELMIPLTIQLNSLKTAQYDQQNASSPSSTLSHPPQNLAQSSTATSATLADCKFGYSSTGFTVHQQQSLFQQQLGLLVDFLNIPIHLNCLQLLQRTTPSFALSRSLTDLSSSSSTTLVRDPLLTSAIYLTLAFENVHKLSQPSYQNRGKKYQQYDTITRPFNEILGDTTSPPSLPTASNGAKKESKHPTSFINLNNTAYSQHVNDITPIDALALVPRISPVVMSYWHGFQAYLPSSSSTNQPANNEMTDTPNPTSSVAHVEKFSYDPQFPIISLIFAVFQTTPEGFSRYSSNPSQYQTNNRVGKRDALQSLQVALLSYQSTSFLQSQAILPTSNHTLSQHLFSPSVTSATLVHNQPHPLLSISLHDICWLLTVSACSSLHLSQFKQFLTLQQHQYSMLMSFDLVGNQDESAEGADPNNTNNNNTSSSSSNSASLTSITFLSSKNHQIDQLKSNNMFPQLLIPPTMQYQYSTLIQQLVLTYKPLPTRRPGGTSMQTSQSQKTPPCPSFYKKPAFLFLYELAGYITCFPYLHTFLTSFHQPTDIPTTASITRASQEFKQPDQALQLSHHQSKQPSNIFTHTHLFQYVNIYAHFSPISHTTLTNNYAQSIHTRYSSSSSIIQSLYFNRALFVLPAYSKLKFSRLMLLLFGFFDQNTFSTLLQQFSVQLSSTGAKIADWFKAFTAYLYIHLVEKKFIKTKLSATDTPIARKSLPSAQSPLASITGIDLYHMEITTFATCQQDQSTTVKLPAHYSTLQFTKRSLLTALCRNALHNLDLTAAIQLSSANNQPPIPLTSFMSQSASKQLAISQPSPAQAELSPEDAQRQAQLKSSLFQSFKQLLLTALPAIIHSATPSPSLLLDQKSSAETEMSDLDAPHQGSRVSNSNPPRPLPTSIFSLNIIDSSTIPSIPPLFQSILGSLYQVRAYYTDNYIRHSIINFVPDYDDNNNNNNNISLEQQFQIYSRFIHSQVQSIQTQQSQFRAKKAASQKASAQTTPQQIDEPDVQVVQADVTNTPTGKIDQDGAPVSTSPVHPVSHVIFEVQSVQESPPAPSQQQSDLQANTQAEVDHSLQHLLDLHLIQSVFTLTSFFEQACVQSQDIIDEQLRFATPNFQTVAQKLSTLWTAFAKQLCILDLYVLTNFAQLILCMAQARPTTPTPQDLALSHISHVRANPSTQLELIPALTIIQPQFFSQLINQTLTQTVPGGGIHRSTLLQLGIPL